MDAIWIMGMGRCGGRQRYFDDRLWLAVAAQYVTRGSIAKRGKVR